MLFKLELSARHKQLILYFRELAAYYQEHLIFKTFGGLLKDLTHKCFIKNESLQKHGQKQKFVVFALITSSIYTDHYIDECDLGTCIISCKAVCFC